MKNQRLYTPSWVIILVCLNFSRHPLFSTQYVFPYQGPFLLLISFVGRRIIFSGEGAGTFSQLGAGAKCRRKKGGVRISQRVTTNTTTPELAPLFFGGGFLGVKDIFCWGPNSSLDKTQKVSRPLDGTDTLDPKSTTSSSHQHPPRPLASKGASTPRPVFLSGISGGHLSRI